MKTPLYEQIYDYIIEQVNKGFLNYGDRVPSEKELSDKFNVSRITSKKALDLLAQNLIIERIRGKGSFVSKRSNEEQEYELVNTSISNESEKRYTVALVIPGFSDNFGTTLVKAIERACTEKNANLIIRQTHGKIEEEEKAIKQLVNDSVDGLIIFPVHGENYNVELLKLSLKNFPLVLVDRYLKGIPASSVCTDNRLASEQITNYLFTLGHQNIGFISSSPIGTSAIEERIQGFQLAYSKQGIQLKQEFMLLSLLNSLDQEQDNESLFKTNYEIIKKFIQSTPSITAFVACEYDWAILITKVLQDLGHQIPTDYSLVCFDSPTHPFKRPDYTHIKQSEGDIANKAVDILYEHISLGKKDPKHIVIDFTFLEGLST
ncbi:GntR family transcriptional regulator [Metabacillus schmidteae]|uniref:GntR family transcriptional regulator n=1 Tax=Metabacillus schmidteae TaxID=2730405 RepID=UPI00158A49A9|nr:GntR family transcriptional regulator [Metabacillus schmidteae]